MHVGKPLQSQVLQPDTMLGPELAPHIPFWRSGALHGDEMIAGAYNIEKFIEEPTR